MALLERIEERIEERTATLMCEGLCGRFTRHAFARKDRTPDPDDERRYYLVHVRECEGCGDERVFGNEEYSVQ